MCAKVPALRRKNSTEDYGGGSFSLTCQDYGGVLKHHLLPTQFFPWSKLDLLAGSSSLSSEPVGVKRQEYRPPPYSSARIQTTGIRFPALFLASHSFGLSRFPLAKLVQALKGAISSNRYLCQLHKSDSKYTCPWPSTFYITEILVYI